MKNNSNSNTANTATTPVYIHDCDACQFLGHVDQADHYRCLQEDGQTWELVARTSSRPPAYRAFDTSLPVRYLPQDHPCRITYDLHSKLPGVAAPQCG